MKEDLLHLVWKLKKINFTELVTTSGESIKIKKFGFHNKNAGPDFLNAEVIIGDTTWVGHIEMHVNASEWNQHKHHKDLAYNNVILHVVYHNDKAIVNQNGQSIPTLVLNDRIEQQTIENYEALKASQDWIPCAKSIHKTDLNKTNIFLDKVLTERLTDKCFLIHKILDHNNNNWEDTLYRILLKYFGLKVNNSAFEQLAHVTPYKVIKKISDKAVNLEALLLGQSGLINDTNDEYINHLKKEYKHFQHKYDLISMTGVEWKFSKLRPPNFPSIRIAQIAQLYHQSPQLFNQLINAESKDQLYKIFSVTASEYWDTHYIPNKQTEPKPKKIGKNTKDLLIINVVSPIIFAYGVKLDNQKYKDRAIEILQQISSENNSIIRNWIALGMNIKSAYDTQALIQLKNVYCNQFKCLHCQIGQSILFS